MKHYFLFGTDAVQLYFETNSVTEVRDRLDGDYAVFCFTEGESPISLLDAYTGWFDYTKITEAEYLILNNN